METQFNKNQDRRLIMSWLQGALENHHFDFTATITWMIKHGNDYRYEYQRQAFQRLTIDQRNQIMAKLAQNALGHKKVGAN
jgi:hypothetical protein